MDPPQPTPQTNHDGRPKRRRLRSDSTAIDPAIERIVPSRTHSPIATSITNVEPPINDDGSDLSCSSSQPLLTQPPHIANTPPPSTPPPNCVYYAPAPSRLLPINAIPTAQKEIIQHVIKDLYSIDTPRDFQIKAINHLSFSDDASLIVIRRTADGKSLIPLATSALRGGVSLIITISPCLSTLFFHLRR